MRKYILYIILLFFLCFWAFLFFSFLFLFLLFFLFCINSRRLCGIVVLFCIFNIFCIFWPFAFYSILLFCTNSWQPILFFTYVCFYVFYIFTFFHFFAYFHFLYFSLSWTDHMNFHAKSGVCSSKNEGVMLNLVCLACDQPMYSGFVLNWRLHLSSLHFEERINLRVVPTSWNNIGCHYRRQNHPRLLCNGQSGWHMPKLLQLSSHWSI